jgi:hypothetical protein
VSTPRPSQITEEEVTRRLEELAQLDRSMRALREVRFLDGADVVREQPTPPRSQPDAPRRDDREPPLSWRECTTSALRSFSA